MQIEENQEKKTNRKFIKNRAYLVKHQWKPVNGKYAQIQRDNLFQRQLCVFLAKQLGQNACQWDIEEATTCERQNPWRHITCLLSRAKTQCKHSSENARKRCD